jgi:hypothetical protein
MLEHLAEIAAIDPAIAGGAPNEMLGLIFRRIADALAQIFSTRDHHGISWRRLGCDSAGAATCAIFAEGTK